MADERTDAGYGGFLPPEPGGPEPELGQAPPGPAVTPAPAQDAPPAQQPGWQPPPAQGWQAPPTQGWQPPPTQGWQAPPSQPWVYQPQPAVPDNGSAVAGFVLSVSAAALLVLSAGVSSIISVVCAGLGMLYSRRGTKRVDRGETPKHRGLAQAGFITGIVTLILALLATAFWISILVLYLSNEEFRRDFENEFDSSGSDGIQSTVRLAGTLGRIAFSLIA